MPCITLDGGHPGRSCRLWACDKIRPRRARHFVGRLPFKAVGICNRLALDLRISHMLRRGLHLFLACFWLFWIGVILPVHTVGFVPLQGASAMAGAPVCPMCLARAAKSGKTPPAPPASGCALCDLKAKLYSGTLVVADLEPCGVHAVDRISPPLVPFVQSPPLPSDSRAPPPPRAV